jgi:chromosome segregation ATPase
METANQDDVNYTDVVSGLLQETNDWINIQDIIKLTFKSVFDVIKSQSELIKEIESQLPSKTNKSELTAALQLKHDYADFTKYASEINNKKADKEDIERQVALLKNEYNEKLNKATLTIKDDIKSSIESVGVQINSDIANIKGNIDTCLKTDIYDEKIKELEQRLDYDEKIKELEQRLDNLSEKIEGKPNTTDITTALHKKANKADVDALLLTKAEKSDIDGNVQQLSTKIGEINDDVKQLDSNINQIKESYQTKLNEMAKQLPVPPGHAATRFDAR